MSERHRLIYALILCFIGISHANETTEDKQYLTTNQFGQQYLAGVAPDLTNIFEVNQKFQVDVYINWYNELEFFRGN